MSNTREMGNIVTIPVTRNLKILFILKLFKYFYFKQLFYSAETLGFHCVPLGDFGGIIAPFLLFRLAAIWLELPLIIFGKYSLHALFLNAFICILFCINRTYNDDQV